MLYRRVPSWEGLDVTCRSTTRPGLDTGYIAAQEAHDTSTKGSVSAMAAYPAPHPCQLPFGNVFPSVAINLGLGIPFLVAQVPVGSVSQAAAAPTIRLSTADKLPHKVRGLTVFLGDLQVAKFLGRSSPLLTDEWGRCFSGDWGL
jgi:hypothetical protein